jgi:glucose-6-phosphate 1-dehydrogenase
MSDFHSDALVFFGVTGDLAYKKILPVLQAMVMHGHLSVPIVGVARSGWTLDQLKARAKDSIEKHGRYDAAGFEKLSRSLRYVGGDYNNPATFHALRRELGEARHRRTISQHHPLCSQRSSSNLPLRSARRARG